MKIAIGSRPYDGPWGGGNRFVVALCGALRAQGHTVVHDLHAPDIDIILLTDPRTRAPNVSFGAGGILRHLLRYPGSLVVHRINECDERKGEAFINHRLVRANYVADVSVFVGEWLTQLPVWRQHLREPWYVVRNGADAKVFDRAEFAPWAGTGPLRLVTHHWGYHPNKGFDVYRALDDLLGEPSWKDRLAFTYVGNLPKGFSFRKARYVPPLDGKALADELRSHHAYVTGSINEPGGNHQNEGALCGLPLLYRNSGCMPEYCRGFGVAFEAAQDLPAALAQLVANYEQFAARMPAYPHTAAKMTGEWIALLEKLIAERDGLVDRRHLWRDPLAALATQWPL